MATPKLRSAKRALLLAIFCSFWSSGRVLLEAVERSGRRERAVTPKKIPAPVAARARPPVP
jgi:hypothetical protein